MTRGAGSECPVILAAMRHRWVHRMALFILALLFLQLGYLGSFQIRRWMAREAMEGLLLAGSPEDELNHFRFSADEYDALAWEERGREFRLQGRLYDVVRVVKGNEGFIELWCIDDERETRLMDAMVSVVGEEPADGALVDTLLMQLCAFHDPLSERAPGLDAYCASRSCRFANSLIDRPSEPQAPPPRT